MVTDFKVVSGEPPQGYSLVSALHVDIAAFVHEVVAYREN
jgi:hypothetical protein